MCDVIVWRCRGKVCEFKYWLYLDLPWLMALVNWCKIMNARTWHQWIVLVTLTYICRAVGVTRLQVITCEHQPDALTIAPSRDTPMTMVILIHGDVMLHTHDDDVRMVFGDDNDVHCMTSVTADTHQLTTTELSWNCVQLNFLTPPKFLQLTTPPHVDEFSACQDPQIAWITYAEIKSSTSIVSE